MFSHIKQFEYSKCINVVPKHNGYTDSFSQ